MVYKLEDFYDGPPDNLMDKDKGNMDGSGGQQDGKAVPRQAATLGKNNMEEAK